MSCPPWLSGNVTSIDQFLLTTLSWWVYKDLFYVIYHWWDSVITQEYSATVSQLKTTWEGSIELHIMHTRYTFLGLRSPESQPERSFPNIPFHQIMLHSIPDHSGTLYFVTFHSIPQHSIAFYSVTFHPIPFHNVPFHSFTFHSFMTESYPVFTFYTKFIW